MTILASPTIADAMTFLQAEEDRAVDLILPPSRLRFAFHHDAVVVETADAEACPDRWNILPCAHTQWAHLLGIPRTYYQRLLAEAPRSLVLDTLNTWLRHLPSDDPLLLRFLRPRIAGAAEPSLALRAVLTPRYRPISHRLALHTVLNALQPDGAPGAAAPWRIDMVQHTDTTSFCRIRLTVYERPLATAHVNDVLRFGVSLTNSEIGEGAVRVAPFAMVLRCRNGYVADQGGLPLRTVHRGRSEQRVIERLCTLTRTAVAQHADLYQTFARAVTVVAPRTTALPTWFAAVGQAVGLTEEETADLIAHGLTEVQRRPVSIATSPSLWEVAQAVTRIARDADPEREAVLATVGYDLLRRDAEFLRIVDRMADAMPADSVPA